MPDAYGLDALELAIQAAIKRGRRASYLGHTDRRYAVLPASLHRSYFRDCIYERDRGICQLCREPIRGAWDLDHIIPKSRGGADHWDNLRLTHPRCNRSRGNLACLPLATLADDDALREWCAAQATRGAQYYSPEGAQ